MENQKALLAVIEKCTGCNRCVYACSAVKEGCFIPSLSRIKINNFPLEGFSAPSVCFQCPKPECFEACPEQAIYKDGAGVVLVDRDKCDGCGDCVAACPYGMIEQYPDTGRAFKCDLCGGEPACVTECQFGALLFVEPDIEQKKLIGRQMKQRSAEGSAEAKRHNLGRNLMTEIRV
ncbi:MAG: 4Fe-4S dicluster domain-containing protein [Thermodesulfobacteriota bacterium]